MVGVIGVNYRIFKTLAKNGISVFMVSQASSENNTTFAVRNADADLAVQVLNDEFALERAQGDMNDTVAEKELNRVYANLRKAKAKGIGLTIGSDSFCSSLTPYGTTAIGEMYSFVEKAGISEMDTIVAATKAGAEMLKVDNVTGSLAEGKSADLLVINGNPLENIRAIAVENMDVIMKEGYFVKR